MLKTHRQHVVLTLALSSLMLMTMMLSCSSDKLMHSEKMQVLDTYADVTIAGADEDSVRRAIKDVEQELKAIDHISYTFHEGSELSALNTAIADGEALQVSDELVELIELSKQLSEQSGGLFNPAVGELTALWEFHCEAESCSESPFPDEIKKLVAEKEKQVIASSPSMSDIKLSGNIVSTGNRHIRLEFGDIIRGYALDKSIEHLRALNIKNAMVEIGDDVRIIGHKKDHPWWVGIQDATGEHLLGTIELTQASALVTARALARSHDTQGSVYRHVIDPSTGMPVDEISRVTVIHDSGAEAAVAATALLIAGLDGWYQLAEAMGVTAVLMYTRDGTLYLSPAMSDRMHWKQEMPHKLLVPGNRY